MIILSFSVVGARRRYTISGFDEANVQLYTIAHNICSTE
jgi:hypothetical protein